MSDEKKPFNWDRYRKVHGELTAACPSSDIDFNKGLFDLDDRVRVLELKEGIGAHEIRQLELQILDMQKNPALDPRKGEYAVRRELESLMARVAQFVEWLRSWARLGSRSTMDSLSRAHVEQIESKLRELGLVEKED